MRFWGGSLFFYKNAPLLNFWWAFYPNGDLGDLSGRWTLYWIIRLCILNGSLKSDWPPYLEWYSWIIIVIMMVIFLSVIKEESKMRLQYQPKLINSDFDFFLLSGKEMRLQWPLESINSIKNSYCMVRMMYIHFRVNLLSTTSRERTLMFEPVFFLCTHNWSFLSWLKYFTSVASD